MPPRFRFLPAILGSLSAFGPLAIDMYLPAFPTLEAELGAAPAQVQGTLAACLFGFATGQVAYGPLADRFGRKPPLLVGLALFVLASLGCALTQDADALTAWRVLQGLGGCAGTVLARAVVRDVAEGQEAVRLLARLVLVMGAAPILAPLLGSWLLAVAGWRAIFGVLAAYGAGIALLVLLALPESLPAEHRRREGFAGVLRLYAKLLIDRRFLGNALSGALPMGGMFAYIAGSPFAFMQLHGLSPSAYTWLFGLNAAGFILMAQTAPALTRRTSPGYVLRRALPVTAAAGLLLLGSAVTGVGGLVGLAVPQLVFIASLGFIMPMATALAMAPYGRAAGSASAVLGTLQFGMGAVAGALVGALHDGTAVPMAAVVCAGGVGGLLAQYVLAR